MPDDATPVVTRFAPSPTGALHVGGARTALFNWAYARGRGGRFLLRLEDTDRARSSDAAAEGMLADLAWCGVDWDNAGDVPKQSERLDLYNAAVARLRDAGLAYDEDGAVRFRMDRDVAFEDEVYGRIAVKAADLEDFVIRKAPGSDGLAFPTFHLAVVVDDADMGVTHVIRGQEHLSNTAKHVALQDALGLPRPVYAHTPSIMNADGSKMSKRDKAKAARAAVTGNEDAPRLLQEAGLDADAVSAFATKQTDDPTLAVAIAAALGVALPEIEVADFRRSGYLPGVLCGYLALLGWNPGGEIDERFDLDYLKRTFDLGGINRKNARFDRDKLFRFNGEALQAMAPETFARVLRQHFEAYHADVYHALLADGDKFVAFAAAYQPRSRTLDEPAALGRFFVDAPTAYDAKAVKKHLHKGDPPGHTLLAPLADALAAVDPWTGEAAQAAVEAVAEQHGVGMGKAAQPLRVAVSGAAVTPPIDVTLGLLGKDETVKRLKAAAASLQPSAA